MTNVIANFTMHAPPEVVMELIVHQCVFQLVPLAGRYRSRF